MGECTRKASSLLSVEFFTFPAIGANVPCPETQKARRFAPGFTYAEGGGLATPIPKTRKWWNA